MPSPFYSRPSSVLTTHAGMSHVLFTGFDSEALGGVSAVLEDDGFDVTHTGDAVAALEVLDAEPVDCVAVAADLGPVDSRQFVRELRERGHSVPIVLLVDGDTTGPIAGAVVVRDAPDEVARRIEDIVASRRLAEEARRRRRQRAAVEAAEATVADSEPERVETVLCRELADSVAYHSAWIGRYDAGAETVVPVAAAGLPLAFLGRISVDDAPDTVTAWAAAGAVAVDTDGEHAILAVPLGDEPLGVLHLQADRPNGVPESERSSLAELGEAVAARIAESTGDRPGIDDPFTVLGDALAHELGNQLDIATTHLGLARDREDDETHLEHVETALDRMAALAEDARALARGDVEPDDHDLSAAATEAWQTVETADATLDADAGTVRADGDLLALLFENLFRNAIEHGGGDVTVRTGPLAGGGFYVADDGHGIPEDERETAFDWGHSGDDGAGVGLGIVALVAERHGWAVDCEQSEAGGARFEFTPASD